MRIVRFLLLFLGAIALFVAVIAVAAELRAFVADGKLLAKPLGKIWFDLHKDSLLLLQPAIERYLHPWLWGGIVQPLLEQAPLATAGAFGALGVVLVWLGRLGGGRRP